MPSSQCLNNLRPPLNLPILARFSVTLRLVALWALVPREKNSDLAEALQTDASFTVVLLPAFALVMILERVIAPLLLD